MRRELARGGRFVTQGATRRLRVGVINVASPLWTAGASYSLGLAETLGRAIDPARVELSWLAPPDSPPPPGYAKVDVASPPATFARRVTRRLEGLRTRLPIDAGAAESWLRERLGLLDAGNRLQAAHAAGLDVVLPSFEPAPAWLRPKTIGWIPDFQHRFLPDYFSKEESAQRDIIFRAVADHSSRVMLSSHDAAAHFAEFAPDLVGKARVIPFGSLFAHQPPTGDPSYVIGKYHLPPKFALIANQFWNYKNHVLAVDAMAKVGFDVPLVVVGRPADRDPRNGTVSTFLQRIAERGLAGKVFALGEVPWADLVALLRTTALVVQPSRFEGWNTTVEDAKALGRAMVCSDLSVHREQAKNALGFFGCDDADGLAALLRERWAGLRAGPDPEREAAALVEARRFSAECGEKLVAVCEEAGAGANEAA